MNFFKKLFGKPADTPLVTKRSDAPDVYHISSEEDRMNQGMEKARKTLNYFKSSLLSPSPFQSYFSLKARIVDGDIIEHIWLSDVSFDDSNVFYGKIGNAPLNVSNVKFGQQVGISFSDVSDWMIVEDGKLIGGYTIRAIRDGLKGNQLSNFDKNLGGLIVDEGVDYFEHDFTTPEGALLCLEDAFDEKNIDKAINCKDFQEEAKLMLQKMEKMKTMADDQEIITATADALRLSFIKHMQENGFPNFIGVKRAFPQKKFINPDLVILTEICIYPNHPKSSQQMYLSKKNGEWKVLSPAQ